MFKILSVFFLLSQVSFAEEVIRYAVQCSGENGSSVNLDVTSRRNYDANLTEFNFGGQSLLDGRTQPCRINSKISWGSASPRINDQISCTYQGHALKVDIYLPKEGEGDLSLKGSINPPGWFDKQALACTLSIN